MKVLESEQTLFHHILNGADTQKLFRDRTQDIGKATVCDELGINIPLMPVCESIDKADNMRLRNELALGHRGGA